MGGEHEALSTRRRPNGEDSGAAADSQRAAAFGRRPWQRVFAVVSVGFVLWVAWTARAEVADAFRVIQGLPMWVLGGALLLETAAVAALAQVYRSTVEGVGDSVSYPDSLQVSMGAFTLSRVLPGGGAAGAVWASARLRDAGVHPVRAWTAVVLEGVLAMATLGALVSLGTVAALLRGHVGAGSVLLVLSVAAVLGLVSWMAVGLLRSTEFRHRVLGGAARLFPRWEARLGDWNAVVAEVHRTLPPVRRLLPVVGWSAANWLLDVAALWAVFVGLGHRLELGVLLVGFGVANLATALPHTPGGIGLVEAGMTGAFVALGAPTPVALAAVLAYRLISFWLPVLAGVPQYLRPVRPVMVTGQTAVKT